VWKKTKQGIEIDSQEADKGNAPRFKGGSYPSRKSIETAGKEMKNNPPSQLAKTKKKFGKAREKKQKIAMMLSKARKEG
jgi:hypothetical protein